MIFWQLFYTFCKIGIFNFGGGYAMIALIQNEVVFHHGWMTAQEFTDMVAVSQLTPGPVGINVATYAGYTAVVNAGFAPWLGVVGAFVASFAVVLLPFLVLLAVSEYLHRQKANPVIISILSFLRLAIVGVIAAAALQLVTPESFGTLSQNPFQVVCSCVLFLCAFLVSYRYKTSPILLIVVSGLLGFLLYF